jgi:hypothetical protein
MNMNTSRLQQPKIDLKGPTKKQAGDDNDPTFCLTSYHGPIL